jgi:hypothetical protein
MCSKCLATATHGKYCAAHKDTERQRDRQRQRVNADNPLYKLYKCKLWRVFVRDEVLMRDPQCVEVENGVRCQRLATDIHHVVDADTWVAQGSDFYDTDNLAGLCHAHHSRYTGRNNAAQKRT